MSHNPKSAISLFINMKNMAAVRSFNENLTKYNLPATLPSHFISMCWNLLQVGAEY
jgi:hypothetical protein